MDSNTERNRCILGLEKLESRSLLYNLVLKITGVEVTKGATLLDKDSQFELGRKSVAIEIINELYELCPEIVEKMKKEVKDYGEY